MLGFLRYQFDRKAIKARLTLSVHQIKLRLKKGRKSRFYNTVKIKQSTVYNIEYQQLTFR